MSVRFRRNGNVGLLTACAKVRTSSGLISLKIIETQSGSKGKINSALQLSLNGKPLLISRSITKPGSSKSGCSCNNKCKTCTKRTLKVINGALLNRFSRSIDLLFAKLRKQLLAFIKRNPNFSPNLPCFITLAICRVTEARVVASCRLMGKPLADCIREGETFYNICKGDC